jgi:hypothetical protein
LGEIIVVMGWRWRRILTIRHHPWRRIRVRRRLRKGAHRGRHFVFLAIRLWEQVELLSPWKCFDFISLRSSLFLSVLRLISLWWLFHVGRFRFSCRLRRRLQLLVHGVIRREHVPDGIIDVDFLFAYEQVDAVFLSFRAL